MKKVFFGDLKDNCHELVAASQRHHPACTHMER